MLSPQTPHQFPGRHQRQNSTPTRSNTPKTTLPVTHRRGLSLDQPEYAHHDHGLFQQKNNRTSVEYTLGQRLTQAAFMRETQPQTMARPGRDQQVTYEQLIDIDARKAMPCLEHGNGSFSNNYMTTPTTEFDNHVRHSLQEMYNLNTTGYLQFDTTTSAGTLDGFGNGLDGNIGNIQPNKTMQTVTTPNGMRSTAGSRPTSSEGVQQPCTPPSQMRMSKENIQSLPHTYHC